MAATNLIIKAGTKLPSLESHAGDYEQWMAQILNWDKNDYQTVSVYLGETLPPVDKVKRVIITGAGAMVTDDEPWINESAEWLATAAKTGIPILGICFGHQLLAYALGARVGDNPRGVEVGSVPIQLTEQASEDSLFQTLPKRFSANVSHMQSVLELPVGARLLAYSEDEPVHAFAYGEQVWGIQFHPEFDAEIVKHYIRYYDPQLKAEGRDIKPLLAHAIDTPESCALLGIFAQIQGG
ncbi:MAG: glutamine amidotransferase [Gammaproteobacteria bacterium]|nr:glutamine amidotransferase [Gammaproteobacteria bacterium]